MSSIISEECSKNFKAWQLPQVGDAVVPTPDIPLPKEDTQKIAEQVFQQAYLKGLAAGEDKKKALEDELQQTLKIIHQPVNLLKNKIEQHLITCVKHIVSHYLGQELQAHPEYLLTIIERTLEVLAKKITSYKIHLNPTDFTLLQQFKQQLGDKVELEMLLSDAALQRGEVKIPYDQGTVSSSIQTTMETLINEWWNESKS